MKNISKVDINSKSAAVITRIRDTHNKMILIVIGNYLDNILFRVITEVRYVICRWHACGNISSKS